MFQELTFISAICYVLKLSEAHFLHGDNNYHHLVENKEELVNFIKSLGPGDAYKSANNSDDANDEEKEKKLQTMLWLIKKNFNAQKNLDFIQNNPLNSGARVYFLNNPAVLNEYMRHRKKMRRFSNQNTRKVLRRKDSIGSDGVDAVINKMLKFKPKNTKFKPNRSNNPDVHEKSGDQILNRDFADENAEQEVRKTRYQKKTRGNILSDDDYRPQKHNRDDDAKDTNKNVRKRKKYADDTINNDLWETKVVSWDKTTARDYSNEYKNKKSHKESQHQSYKAFQEKRKPSYDPKKEYVKNDFHLYGRTSIPFIGKRGVFDEK
ncbi:uncharacterized protein LOC116778527 isoform X2 [Danaus plexippus]|uniref:uncharacterized protein LOC116778527 isoform X2 n=1 Tax=Danaus plexippus TaxID=13037 RepID=UPI002AB1EC86|nr:uncharacterized protein LOC116778527 isoform X2 [Danaus plexippus]